MVNVSVVTRRQRAAISWCPVVPDCRRILSGAADGEVRIWDFDSEESVGASAICSVRRFIHISWQLDSFEVATLSDHTGAVPDPWLLVSLLAIRADARLSGALSLLSGTFSARSLSDRIRS